MTTLNQLKLQPTFDHKDLGAKCHQQQQAQYFVCVVTDLENKILLSNATPWKVTKARTNINRYWQASTAFFQASIELTDLAELSPERPKNVWRPDPIAAVASGLSNLQLPTDSAQRKKLKTELEEFKKEAATIVSNQDQQGDQATAANQKALDNLIKNQSPEVQESLKTAGWSFVIIADSVRIEAANKSLDQVITTLGTNAQSILTAPEQDKNFPLYISDEVCLYFGYLDTLRAVTLADITSGRLLRKGVWVIDTISQSGNANTGIIMTVQCRDRLKYLMDTFGSYNTAEQQDFLVGGSDTTFKSSSRSNVILSISQRGIGDLGDNGTGRIAIGGRTIDPGFTLDIALVAGVAGKSKDSAGETAVVNALKEFDPYLPYSATSNSVLVMTEATTTQATNTRAIPAGGKSTKTELTADNYGDYLQRAKDAARAALDSANLANPTDPETIKKAQENLNKLNKVNSLPGFIDYLDQEGVTPIGGQNNSFIAAIPRLAATTKNLPVSKDLIFNIVTGRAPFVTEADKYFGQNFMLADRVPLDFIRFLSQQEPWPTEVFQDHRTGQYWYAPRGLDMSGLSDRSRFYRTYYFRNYPSDLVEVSNKAQAAKKATDQKELDKQAKESLNSQISDLDDAAKNNDKIRNNVNAALVNNEQYQQNVDRRNVFSDQMSRLRNTISQLEQFSKDLTTPFNTDEDLVNLRNAFNTGLELSGLSQTEKTTLVAQYNLESAQSKVLASKKLAATLEAKYKPLQGSFSQAVTAINTAESEAKNRVTAELEKQKNPLKEQAVALQNSIDAQIPNAGLIPVAPGFTSPAPHYAQMIHSFREEASSISLRTNIIVQSQSPNSANSIQDFLHLIVEPYFMKGRAYPCTFFTVTDDSAGLDVAGALIAVAISYARVISKEIRVAAATVLGDPSFCPGEVIQVIGSPQNLDALTPGSPYYWSEDRQLLSEMLTDYQALHQQLARLAAQSAPSAGGQLNLNQPNNMAIENPVGGQVNITTTKKSADTQTMLTDSYNNKNQGINYIAFPKEPPSMWRVEGVVDRFNDGVPGYYTELSLLSCF